MQNLSRHVFALVGVRAEIVALRLDKVGRKPCAAVRVEVSKGGRKSGRWYSEVCSRGGHRSQRFLPGIDLPAEMLIHQKVLEIGPPAERGTDGIEEGSTDNASSTPDPCHRLQVQSVLIAF